MVITSWLDGRERDAIAYLVEENRLLREVATVVPPDTLLHWHRQLIARNRKWTVGRRRASRRGVLAEIQR
jgi:hypothetical protein